MTRSRLNEGLPREGERREEEPSRRESEIFVGSE